MYRFPRIYACRKNLSYTDLFSLNDHKKSDKIIYNYFKDKYEEASLDFRLRKIDETRNDLLHEIKHNDLMNKKYKRTYKYLNYVEHLLFLVSAVTSCVSISAFASLVCVAVGNTSSVVGIKIFVFIT